MGLPGTDPTHLLHRLLVGPTVLERVPGPLIPLFLAALAGGVGASWDNAATAVGWLAFVLLDWGFLAGLARARRSFGPVHPPLLALAVLRAVVAGVLSWTACHALLWAASAVIGCLLAYATWVEPFRITITRRERAWPQWPSDTRPIRLLHLSDLHLEREGLLSARLKSIIDQTSPDLICFTGDLLNLSYNRQPVAVEEARAVVGRWTAPSGVYAVSGSPLVDLPETAQAVLAGHTNLHWLQGRAHSLQFDGVSLTLVGLSCSHDPAADGARLREALNGVPIDGPVVLLYHTPDLAPQAAAAGVDLQLSGHTHGGQIRLPCYGALVTSSVYGKRFEMGEYRVARDVGEPMILYVSRGIGMEGGAAPRARFLCKPEVILWTFRGSAAVESAPPPGPPVTSG